MKFAPGEKKEVCSSVLQSQYRTKRNAGNEIPLKFILRNAAEE